MELRSLIGPNKGKVLDFSPQAAFAMLADGRAELVSEDCFRPPAAGEAPAVAVGETVTPAAQAVAKPDVPAFPARKPAAKRSNRGARK